MLQTLRENFGNIFYKTKSTGTVLYAILLSAAVPLYEVTQFSELLLMSEQIEGYNFSPFHGR